ncbi:MAG: CRISPR-associated helicase Cas3' [Candidatus Omnitrophica bacterium]|nr:CRISPR-associated helicase Cas3' [Candidatus Omnitrophota bacterium]
MLKPRNTNPLDSDGKILPLKDCLAKTIRVALKKIPGTSVETHCKIVGYVALELMKRMPLWLVNNFYPKGSELIAAVHDIGKVSPTFQQKIYRDIGKDIKLINCTDEAIGWHWTVSQAATEDSPKYISEIIGRHHGTNPQNINNADAQVYGGKNWQKQRQELINILKLEFKVDWPKVSDDLHSDILAGLTVISDWIGSGSLFDHAESMNWKEKISEALDNAGFISPKVKENLSFEDIFELSPYDIQIKLFQTARDKGVYVLEAPMGLGKTEAALYAAYKALEGNRATGIYFALPTQLTSDKIHLRMEKFLDKILSYDSLNRKPLLLHSAAWLQDTEIGEDGSPGKSWFNSAKRGLLAPFAVGTIDQALMAVMRVKHGFVRTFGLAGKVVILDEVHSYDSYTGTILNELVAALRKLHCTVIILSATLTDKQRRAIIGSEVIHNSSMPISDYPLISSFCEKGLEELPVQPLTDVSVMIKMSDNCEAIEEALLRAERNEQVLWIENTVKEAQDIFCILSARASGLNIECGLLHSRFIKKDRADKETKWVEIFGKSDASVRQKCGRILVGTQILEQSLDIDADFLVTRICPTDMLFQRIGRLWRHEKTMRPVGVKREAWILSPKLNDAIKNKKSFGNYFEVYNPYVLCRTLEIFQNISSINIPSDIRILLNKTYEDRDEKDEWAKYKKELEGKRESLKKFALNALSKVGKTWSDSEVSTRYSETESVEVLLIRKVSVINSDAKIKFLDNSEIILPKQTDSKTKRKLSAELLRNTVMVPDYLVPNVKTNELLWLKNYVYLGDNEESVFKVAIIDDAGCLKRLDGTDASQKYNLYYDEVLGYRAIKK